jgi:hypothetical protein
LKKAGIMTTRHEFAERPTSISYPLPGKLHRPVEQALFLEIAEDLSFALNVIETEMRRRKGPTLEEKARQLELLVSEHPSGFGKGR